MVRVSEAIRAGQRAILIARASGRDRRPIEVVATSGSAIVYGSAVDNVSQGRTNA